MASDAYERNFQGLASAIDTAHKNVAALAKELAEAGRQHQDLLIRVAKIEEQIRLLVVLTSPRGSRG